MGDTEFFPHCIALFMHGFSMIHTVGFGAVSADCVGQAASHTGQGKADTSCMHCIKHLIPVSAPSTAGNRADLGSNKSQAVGV